MLKIIKSVFGSQADREYKKLSPTITEINAYVAQYSQLSDEQLVGKTAEFRALLAERTGSRSQELAAVETQLRGDLDGDERERLNDRYDELEGEILDAEAAILDEIKVALRALGYAGEPG